MKVTQTNSKGIDLIKSFEGLKLVAYVCPANVPTIGYGTIRYPNGNKVKLGDTCTNLQAETYLKHDLKQFELSVDALCRDDLNANQFSALVSFAYNLGSGSLKSSTLLKKVNANPLDPTIRKEFMRWIYAGPLKLSGLERRRTAEADLYFL
jgi:lysozyme